MINEKNDLTIFYKMLLLIILTGVTVTSYLEQNNHDIPPKNIKIGSMCIYGGGAAAFLIIFIYSIMLAKSGQQIEFYWILLSFYATAQFLLLLFWTMMEFQQFHVTSNDQLDTSQDIVFYSGLLMIASGIISFLLVRYLKNKLTNVTINVRRFWYCWIHFAFGGTFIAFISMSSHTILDQQEWGGHRHLWWLPIIAIILIIMVIFNIYKPDQYNFPISSFIPPVIIAIIWILYYLKTVHKEVWDGVLITLIILESIGIILLVLKWGFGVGTNINCLRRDLSVNSKKSYKPPAGYSRV